MINARFLFLRITLIFLALLIFSQSASALIRRQLPNADDSDKWVYAKDSGERKIAFLALEVKGKKKEGFSNFGVDIARTLASLMDGYKEIELSENDFVPVFKNENYYLTDEYSFNEVKIKSDDLFTVARLNNGEEDDEVAAPESNSGDGVSEEQRLASADEVAKERERLLEIEAANKNAEIEALFASEPAALSEELRRFYVNFRWEEDFQDESILASRVDYVEKEEEKKFSLFGTNDRGEVFSITVEQDGNTNVETNFNAAALTAIQKLRTKPTFLQAIAETNFAFVRTNQQKQKVDVYFYRHPRENYVEVESFAMWQLRSLVESGVDIGEKNGRYYLKSLEKKKQKLSIDKNLYKLNESRNFLALEKFSDANYFVYGTYSHKKRLEVEISLYVLDIGKKIISHFATKNVRLGHLNADLESVPIELLAFLQDKKIIENVKFSNSTDETELLFLDDRFVGKLPLTLKQMVASDYRYRVWSRQRKLDEVKVERGSVDDKTISLAESDERVVFSTTAISGLGSLDVKISDDGVGSFYIGSLLEKAGSSSFRKTLPVGKHLLTVRQQDFNPIRIEVPIIDGKVSSLTFPLDVAQSVPSWKKELFDHTRNARIFAVIGFILAGVTMGSYMETLDIEDRLYEVDRRISSGTNYFDSLAAYRNDLSRQYDTSLRQSAFLFFLGSLPSFLLATISYSLDVQSYQAPLIRWGEQKQGYNWQIFPQSGKDTIGLREKNDSFR